MTPGPELWRHPRVAMVELPSASNAPGVVPAPSRAGEAHEHNYERFARRCPTAGRTRCRGIWEFVVDRGGVGDYTSARRYANSDVRCTDHSVLKLTLTGSVYRWQFIQIPGDRACRDSGTAV
jgi:hypothetical protein